MTLPSTGPTTGAITGVPTTAGTSAFTVRVNDASCLYYDGRVTVTVHPFVSAAVWAWGYGLDGELGGGQIYGSTLPVRVSCLSGVTAILPSPAVSKPRTR